MEYEMYDPTSRDIAFAIVGHFESEHGRSPLNSHPALDYNISSDRAGRLSYALDVVTSLVETNRWPVDTNEQSEVLRSLLED